MTLLPQATGLLCLFLCYPYSTPALPLYATPVLPLCYFCATAGPCAIPELLYDALCSGALPLSQFHVRATPEDTRPLPLGVFALTHTLLHLGYPYAPPRPPACNSSATLLVHPCATLGCPMSQVTLLIQQIAAVTSWGTSSTVCTKVLIVCPLAPCLLLSI